VSESVQSYLSYYNFLVITKQGGDGGIQVIMCTQERYIRSASLYNRTTQSDIILLAVHSTHNIKAYIQKQATLTSVSYQERTFTRKSRAHKAEGGILPVTGDAKSQT
jgi:hypothetical protein